jgi:hypothetical protein
MFMVERRKRAFLAESGIPKCPMKRSALRSGITIWLVNGVIAILGRVSARVLASAISSGCH